MQLRVEAPLCQQLSVRAAFGDGAGIEHQDAVGLLYGGQAMGDDEGRAVAQQLGERRLYVPLRLGVERGSGLIEDEDRCILQ